MKQRNSHLGKSATHVLDSLMVTYGNGELCSRLIYDAINRSYLEKVASYYSFNAGKKAKPYVKLHSEYMRAYPPLGDNIRDIYDEASSSNNNAWKISDHERHTREIQGVGCKVACAEDHTFQVTKNYHGRREIKAEAVWDISVESGEIACAVLVPTTKVKDLSHAAIMVSKRQNFSPSALYSDRWPVKADFWALLFGSHVQGRLGLFHFIQRILKTLRKTHVDYYRALNGLLNCLYYYNQQDYENLLRALKSGTMGGFKHTDEDITDLKMSKQFRDRYGKHLRKHIRPPNIIISMLDDWFVAFKCTASETAREALGRVDPRTGETLFTADTKDAVKNCKEKAQYLQDPLPLEQMYDTIDPNPNSPHGLKEYLSRRGESSLESFHDNLAHFGNSGMRSTLADNLNLTGTARYNLAIRHKLRLARLSTATSIEEINENTNLRKRMPAGWEAVPAFYNHSELQYINELSVNAGVNELPFRDVEKLVSDTGERFFSEYLTWLTTVKPKIDTNDMCLCSSCGVNHPGVAATDLSTATATTQPIATNTNTVGETIANVPPNERQTPTERQLPQTQQQLRPFLYTTPVIWCNPYALPQPAFITRWCCNSYREYSFRQNRVGRPPHDKDCSYKKKR